MAGKKRLSTATTNMILVFLAVGLLSIANGIGAPVIYTDQATFLSNLNSFDVVDFESTAAGTLISDGDTVGTITFNHTIDDGFGGTLDLKVTDFFDTTSGNQYLGVDDGADEVFLDGDNFSMSFAPTQAIGLFVIGSPGDAQAGDITLAGAGASVSNSGAPDLTLGDGGEAFFLGIIEPDLTMPFSSASLSTIGGGFFTYTVDDIITGQPVPEPGTLALLCASVIGLFIGHKRRKRNGNNL